MSQSLNIQNEEVQDELNLLFVEIEYQQITDAREIATQILDSIKKLDKFEQSIVLEFIRTKYENAPFLIYLIPGAPLEQDKKINYQEELEKLKKTRDQKGVLNLLDMQIFYEQKLIPEIVRPIVPILSKLDQSIFFIIIEIIQYSVKSIELSQIQLLKKLLAVKYGPNSIDQKKLDFTIGLLLKQQIFELESFIEEQLLHDNIKQIQKQQSDMEWNGRTFYGLFTENFKAPDYLDKYLKNTLSIEQLELKQILCSLDEFIRKNNDITIIYFKIIIYYWGTSCEYFIDYKQKRIKKYPVDEEIKEQVIQLQIKKHKCEREIPQYFFDRFIYFLENLQRFPFQDFNYYKQQQNEIAQQLKHNLTGDIINSWRKVQLLTSQQFKKIQFEDVPKRFAFKIMWINQYDETSSKQLENLLLNNQQDILMYNLILNQKLTDENLKNDLLALKIIVLYYYPNKIDKFSYWYEPIDYYRIFKITPQILSRRRISLEFPQKMEINLENFNISLAEVNKTVKDQQIDNWIKQMQNQDAFRNLIPFYFNIIKRGESADTFTFAVQESFKRLKIQSKYLNMKALFQIFYNNSNEELKMMLLKLHSKYNPIPLIYQKYSERINSDFDLFAFNHYIFYIFPDCYPIINFSLSRKASRYGKTHLINEIFYLEKKFEVSDNCEINNNTIDIMFDFAFDGSRKLAIADVHGSIPLQILVKILPIFKLWIIQMNSEPEIEENRIALEGLFEDIQDYIVCFMVRNALDIQKQQDVYYLNSGQKIHIYYIQDLSKSAIDQQIKNAEIKQAQHFLYSKIYDYDPTKEQYTIRKNQQLITKSHFTNLILPFTTQNEIENIKSDILIINELKKELSEIMKDELGFYSKQAFPIRSVAYEIKKTRIQISKLGNEEKFSREQFQNLQQKAEAFEISIKRQKPTKLLYLFLSIFSRKNYYILYVWFCETVQQFNNVNYLRLNNNNQEISKRLQSQKQFYDKSQPMKAYIKQLQDELLKSLQEIQLKTINIENFWRELIYQINIVYELIRRGEPFEFLDGDNLAINKEFIQQLALQFNQNNEKVIILSALGPQSSGKSTVLNKIFGCHFLTSVGRTTKGINLQLLKVENKNYFKKQFDYILLLDTEGLQNPNQKDPEFDKKITMLILAVSNIILVIVKGDIHQPEKDLIATCVYNLSQISDQFPTLKQLSWCFNQNDDVNNVEKFKEQLSGVFKNLVINQNEELDFKDMLQMSNENLQILGFATMNTVVCNSWNLQKINDTFSQVALQKCVGLLKNFVIKLEKEQSNLYGLQTFVSDIHNIWDTIQRMPDLLEFNEIILQNQNKKMKENFDREWIQARAQLSQNLNVSHEIENILRISRINQNQDYNQVNLQVQLVVKNRVDAICQVLKEKLINIKETQNISKKIFKKYSELLNHQINQEILEYNFVIQEEIEKFQIQRIKRVCIVKIDSYLQNISDQQYMAFLQNPENVNQVFKKLWEEYNQEYQNSFQKLFSEFQQNLIQILTLTQKDSHLSNDEFTLHLNFFQGQINEREPNDNEKIQIYNNLSERQVSKDNGFMMLPKDRKYQKYNKIFEQDLKNRINLQRKVRSLIKVTECFDVCSQYVCIKKSDIHQYLQNDLLKDLITLIKNQKIENEEIKEFFTILKVFDITHRDTDLDDLIKQISLIRQYQNFEGNMMQICSKFMKNLKFENKVRAIQESEFFVSKHNIYYRKLPYQPFDLKNFDREQNDITWFLKQIPEDHIAIIKGKLFSPKCQGYDQILFQYIISPKENSQYADQFRERFPISFNMLMKNSKNGWKSVFNQVYDQIRDQLSIHVQQNQEDSNNQIQQFYQFRDISKIIEKYILKFNKEFALFGVILRTIGQRYIKYYSLMITWRFICYFKWRRFQELQINKDSLKIEQFQRFKAEILKNKSQQSIVKARVLADKIFQSFKNQYYRSQRNSFILSLRNYSKNSFFLIEECDSEQQQLPLNTRLKYLQHHRTYLNEVVDAKIYQNTQEILYQLKLDFKKQMKQQLENLSLNLNQIIFNQLFQELQEKGAKYLFQEAQKRSDQYYEQKLYIIIINCIQGKPTPLISMLNQKYCQLFQSRFRKVDFAFYDEAISSNEEVQELHPFLNELRNQVQLANEKEQILEIKLSSFGIQNEIENLRRFMKGCQEVCPVCNRKCDQDQIFLREKHRHTCRSGHQIRGIKNVQIQGKPSLYTCDEIQNDDYISFFNTNIVIRWSDYKLLYPDWDFNVLDQYKQQNQNRQLNIWNDEIGEEVCRQLNLKFEKRQLNQRKYHFQEVTAQYIIAIEDTKAMKGNKFEICKKSVCDLIKRYSQNFESKLNLILYNIQTELLINREYFNYYEQESKIEQRSESIQANIYVAFQKILELIEMNKQYNFPRTYVLIHLIQVDSTFDDSIDRMCNLPEEIRKTIIIRFYSYVQYDSINLELIVNQLKKKFSNVEQFIYNQPFIFNELISEKLEFNNEITET